ncbi:MAG: pantetheine-phosphate adenylyltransferase [Geobacter sp.]|nr:pantetheine-phosphate adenylyltransferase [Geobacter sp.]
MPRKIAVYPGSFDPITYGHLDVIDRALQIFDNVIVAVACNSSKNALFEIDERLDLIRAVLAGNDRVKVDTFDGLLVNYVLSQKATVIIRGLRAVSDFEYEFQLAQINRGISTDVETLFMMTSVPYSYLSSSVVKEISSLKGPVDNLVPPLVKKALEKKFA